MKKAAPRAAVRPGAVTGGSVAGGDVTGGEVAGGEVAGGEVGRGAVVGAPASVDVDSATVVVAAVWSSWARPPTGPSPTSAGSSLPQGAEDQEQE